MKNRFFIICICIIHSAICLSQDKENESKIKFSFSERIRLTTIDRSISLDKNQEAWTFSRWRTYLGAEYKPINNLSLKLEFGNEARIWISPGVKKSKLDEIFVNQLYLDYKFKSFPFQFRVGRQNLMFDEGFICLDGNPLVGSRSAYFNAIKTSFEINENNKITAFYSYNPKSDELLPVINENDPVQLVEEQTNKGFGLYYKSKIKNINLSTYYFYKGYVKNKKYPEANTNAIGGRVAVPFLSNFVFTTEFAYQFGSVNEFDRNSYGGYSRLEYNFDKSIPIIRQLALGAFYLSGDDPKTETVEGWDPLWSRWPKWSEAFIYTQIMEHKGKVGYWSNINSIHAGIKGSLFSDLSFNLNYHYLMAAEDNEADFCSGKGKIRGNLFIMRFNYPINKNLSGHFLLEHFEPGNFYFKGADKYNWIRFELMCRI